MARLKPTHTQSCTYCHQEYVPVKRGTQRFCSASCRTTYCRKKKNGSLDRGTRIAGPARHQQKGTFVETALASATGALAANAVTQTAEYFAVTKGLVKQVEQLTQLVQQLAADQATTARLLGRGTLNVLTKLGATKEEALSAINTPFQTPTVAPISAQPEMPALPAPNTATVLPAQPQLDLIRRAPGQPAGA
jgi:hypothetical protein